MLAHTVTVPTLWLMLPPTALVLGLYWWALWKYGLPWVNERVQRRIDRYREEMEARFK